MIVLTRWFFPVIIVAATIILAGVISGISPVFAESWYPGQGLKQGDYFRYNVCWTNHNNCDFFEIDFWVKSKTLDGNGWNLEFAAIDGSIKQKGAVTIGMITPDPMYPTPNISDYTNVYKNTIAWLDSCATSETPKDFSLLAWCRNGGVGGQTVSPEGQTDVTVHAGKFKAWMIGWHKGVDSTIWVVPSLPFPIKAQVFADVTQDPIPPQYIFELLETGNSSTEPQFLKNIGVAPPPPKNTNCETPNMQTDSIHNSHNTDTGNMIIEYRYSPSIPKQGCPVEFRLSFEKNFDPNQKYSNVYYDIFTVNDAGKKLASEAQSLGKQNFLAPVGDDDRTLTIKEAPPVTHYVVYISGVATGGNFDTSPSGLVKIDVQTTSVPEFGTLATIVLAAALISIIVISTRTGLRFTAKQ